MTLIKNLYKKPNRHVIFLGAGASYNSGYPIGKDLRLRLSCQKRFVADMEKILGNATSRAIKSDFKKHLDNFAVSIELFRNGGFGTVDEFSKLASAEYPENVGKMKQLMRLAFALHNPEDNFDKSEYYSFIQKLFLEDQLETLNPNTTIISFNYDCYFDFLLKRAYEHRQTLADKDKDRDAEEVYYKNVTTSGFYDPHNLGWATNTSNFSYYKLHGSIAYAGMSKDHSYHHLYFAKPAYRLKGFCGDYYKKNIPPIVFPWELFGTLGNFIDVEDFVFLKQAGSDEQKSDAKILHRLYEEIWRGARIAVKRADKISFVGLSMHSYLEDGFSHLFEGKKGPVEVCVANSTNSNEICTRTAEMMQKVSPDVQLCGSTKFEINFNSAIDGKSTIVNCGINYYPSFDDFINRGMG